MSIRVTILLPFTVCGLHGDGHKNGFFPYSAVFLATSKVKILGFATYSELVGRVLAPRRYSRCLLEWCLCSTVENGKELHNSVADPGSAPDIRSKDSLNMQIAAIVPCCSFENSAWHCSLDGGWRLCSRVRFRAPLRPLRMASTPNNSSCRTRRASRRI